MTYLQSYLYLTILAIAAISLVFLLIYKKGVVSYLQSKNTSTINRSMGVALSITEIWFIIDCIVGYKWASLLHGDLCTMLVLVGSIVFLIGDDKLIKIISPWMLVGSILTFAVGGLHFTPGVISGDINGLLKHILMFYAALLGLFPFIKYTKRQVIWTLGFGVIFLAYVFIVLGSVYLITGEENLLVYSAGLFHITYREVEIPSRFGTIIAGDFTILNISWLPYPIPSIVFYGVVTSLMVTLLWIICTDWQDVANKWKKKKLHSKQQ